MIDPVHARISATTSGARLTMSWRFNTSGTDYRLYCKGDFFDPIPDLGDGLGIVKQLVRIANRINSGVVIIQVSTNSIELVMWNTSTEAAAMARQHLEEAIRAAAVQLKLPVVPVTRKR